MAIVAVSRTTSYESRAIASSLERNLNLVADLETLFRGNVRVFVKVNLLSPFSPAERAIYTHPVLVREVIKILKNWNMSIYVGDDVERRPGDPFSACGLKEALSDLEVELTNLKERGFAEVRVAGKVLEKIYFSREALEADVVINLPKLKTHSFTLYTGAIKNLFGLIPHGLRLKCHREHIWNEDFSQALVDIFSIRPPDLNIMDAVVAMEGEGPSSGDPRAVNLLLSSRDAVALDAVAGKIIGLEPNQVFTTFQAYHRGLGVGDLDLIQTKGERLTEVLVPDFRLSAVAVSLFRRHWPSFLYAYFQEQLAFVPEIKKGVCTGCGDCHRACPAEAISLIQERAWINEAKCIHCLCCQEICAHNSVKLKQKPVGRAIRAAAKLWRRTRSLVS